jgi:hypothetical protein
MIPSVASWRLLKMLGGRSGEGENLRAFRINTCGAKAAVFEDNLPKNDVISWDIFLPSPSGLHPV